MFLLVDNIVISLFNVDKGIFLDGDWHSSFIQPLCTYMWITRVTSSTVPVSAPLDVETGSRGAMEGHKCQGAETEDWNLGAQLSNE